MAENKAAQEKSKAANPNRDKGHRFERADVNWLKKKYPDAVTSRLESKAADARKVDIVGVPYLWQCKYGYPKGIDYHTLSADIRRLNPRSSLPIVVHHKLGRKKLQDLIVTNVKDLLTIIENHNALQTKDKIDLSTFLVVVPFNEIKNYV